MCESPGFTWSVGQENPEGMTNMTQLFDIGQNGCANLSLVALTGQNCAFRL